MSIKVLFCPARSRINLCSLSPFLSVGLVAGPRKKALPGTATAVIGSCSGPSGSRARLATESSDGEGKVQQGHQARL